MAEWDRCRWVWNQCVSRDAELRAEDGIYTTGYALTLELTDWRGRYEWLREGSSAAQGAVVRAWWTARKASFKRQGAPKFKSKIRCLPTLTYGKRRAFSIRDGRLALPKGIVIPVVWSREMPVEPTSVTIKRDAVGHWWASFVVAVEETPLPATGEAVGIDWGVKVTATASEPEFDLPHSEHGKKLQAEIALAQRTLARRDPGSKGYLRTKRHIARLYRKAGWQRKDTARKWARAVVEVHDQIAVEDFKPKFLAKSTMARKAADAAIGQCKHQLLERAQRAGRTVVLVPPAYTTMTCSECGARAKQRLGLSERTFTCTGCGLIADRDRNAARVILVAARFNGACVESVRQPTSVGVDAA